MPDTTPPVIHFIVGFSDSHGPEFACAAPSGNGSSEPGRVTCFACRNGSRFKRAQLAAAPPHRLSTVMGTDEELIAIAQKAKELSALAEYKNHRGMFTIEESIHHGDYRTVRYVEVYEINPTTVDAVLISSAYCYGSWARADKPHTEHRRQALEQLVADLRAGRTNRNIGWSTFRLTK